MLLSTDTPENLELLKTIFENSPIGIFVLDSNKDLVLANPALCNVMKCTVEELAERGVKELSHPNEIEKNINALQCIYRGEELNKDNGFGYRFINKEGSVIHAQLKEHAIKDDNNKIVYLVIMALDMTTLMHTRETLNLRNKEFSLLFENGFDGIIIYYAEL